MKAAIYLRISANELNAGRYDLAIQREKCEAMATLKDWEIAATFVDEGLDGSLAEVERPGLAGLMDVVQGDQVDVAIVSSLNRLATKVNLILSMISQINGFGSVFVACEEGLDTSTPTGQFVLGIFSNLAELEDLPIASREGESRASDQPALRERLPLGYVRGPEGPEIDIVEARKVRRIFELRSDGYSLDEISRWMKFEGIDHPTADQWTPSSIQEVLEDDEKYRGSLRDNGAERWPAILSS